MRKTKRVGYLRVVFSLIVISLLGCSSAKKAPDVDPNDLYAPKFQALSPKTVHLIVSDQREINRNAGNSVEVEQAVYKSVSAALKRGGLRVTNGSKNRLLLVLMDYDGPAAMGECVKIDATLHAKWGDDLLAESFACHQLKHLIGFTMGGDVSQAYMFALNFVLKKLDEDQMHLLGY